MKLNKSIIASLLLSAVLATSCEDMFEEKTNNDWNEDYVWGVSTIAEGVLISAYKAIPNRPDSYDGNFLDVATDNATTSKYGSTLNHLISGDYSSTSNPIGIWGTCYTAFQEINLFLENGLTDVTLYDKVDAANDQAIKARLKGEAYFLRAFWAFRLLQMYGGKAESGEALGYPLIMHFVSEDEAADFENITRSTYAQCAEQIIADCDTAMQYLPLQYTGSDPVTGVIEIGRGSGMAAAALKSKVALYAASPAYQSDDVTQIIRMGEFGVVDEETYRTNWIQAVAAADAALAQHGYVFSALKATDIADAANTTPAEFIFRFYYNNREHETRHFPPYYFGIANTVPSQNLVDAFPMANGFPVSDPRSGFDAQNPYEARDNRFALNIYHHGMAFGNDANRVMDMTATGYESPQYDRFGSRTGYYLAKFISKDETTLNPIAAKNKIHYYPVLRRTELFLNFAEASNEAFGPLTKGSYLAADGTTKTCQYSAYDIIKIIRQQSGGITSTEYLDEMATNKDDFRKLIQNERRIEMAFENQRYWDMRRWVLPLNEAITGVEVKEEAGVVSYTTKTVDERVFNGVKYYYAPLPYNETVKNPNLVNNLGW